MNADLLMNLSLIWRSASEVFPYFDQRDVNWDDAFAAYLPRAAAVEKPREAYLLLTEFAALLGDGHTDVSLPKAFLEETGYLPFQLRHIGAHWCVAAVAGDGEAVLPGTIERLNGEPFQNWLDRLAPYMHSVDGHPSHRRLERLLPLFLPRTGNLLETSLGAWRFDLASQPPAMTATARPEPTLPYRELLSTPFMQLRLFEGDILYLALSDFLGRTAAQTFRETAEALPALRGVILDVRGNIGGMTMFGADIARLFIPGQFHACRKWTRTMEGADFASASQIVRMSAQSLQAMAVDQAGIDHSLRLSRRCLFNEYEDSFGQPGNQALFDQPCILLTDRDTLSAAEDFTAMFRSNHRATILGERTYGSTGTPLLLPLRGGGTARVVSVGYRMLDGTDFINRGIQPDIPMVMSLGDWFAGHDTVLDAAVRRLQ